MDVERYAGRSAWWDEIEHAIDNVKRTKFDKWMRREWHKAAARERWSEGRKAKRMEWNSRRSRGEARNGARRPQSALPHSPRSGSRAPGVTTSRQAPC